MIPINTPTQHDAKTYNKNSIWDDIIEQAFRSEWTQIDMPTSILRNHDNKNSYRHSLKNALI